MTDFEFTPWPKTARLFRDVVITEKIDGTNAAVHIDDAGRVAAQSRNRIITPESDNFGFATWVHEHAADLACILGPGLHFGEWWGRGIQRGYGLESKRFSLFNTDRWFKTGPDGLDSMSTRAGLSGIADQISAVPVLYHGPFSEGAILWALQNLESDGSFAAPGFMNPEGICVFHTQTRSVFKVTLDHNDAGKWEAA
ncbi:RNA ligase family protein [Streptomyces sp. NPDC091259]|uniref:RNA ligase family protein n=1 Tax=Streptomyces sp. NPDC091259 TaxID=3365976 RepID=UPI0037FF21EC